MTNFAQALARIEELTAKRDAWSVRTEQYMLAATELHKLLDKHANSIVQLAKVAQRMRSGLYDDERGAYEYDKLMKGDEG